MVMYTVGILPLINCLNQLTIQVWYADDATAGGKLGFMQNWWNNLWQIGPEYGYSVNPVKTWLL